MRLETATFSAREGLSAHGGAIAVIGDNISNSNTIGYRASRVEFSDIVAEGADGRSIDAIPSTGSGVMIQRVRPVQETGVIEATGRALDVAIEGRGFLMVGDSANPSYTRAGNLQISKDGILTDSNGNPVLGFAGANPNDLATLDVNNLSLNGQATSAASMFGNLNSGNEILSNVPTTFATFNELGQAATYVTNLTVFDSLGGSHEATVAFFRTGPQQYSVKTFMDASEVGGTAGVPQEIDTGAATLKYGTDGKIADADKPNAIITATPAYSGGAAAGNFTVDFSRFTQFAGANVLSSVTQDGLSQGNVKDYQIRANGDFYANMDSGQSLKVGTLQIADFVNVDGMQRAGNGLFIPTSETGARRLGNPGTEGLGTLAGASLERSTVDVAEQFVDLVLMQRGYQANSKTLDTANSLLRDTLSLIR